MIEKFKSFEPPIIKLEAMKINKSYMAKKSEEKSFLRSKTTNDCRKHLPKKYKEKQNVDFTDIPNRSSFHMFKLLKKIGNGEYGKVFLVK